jgi:hypothetical protein
MNNKEHVVAPKTTQKMNGLYQFILKGDTEFQGQFNQAFIRVTPTSLNGIPVDLAVTMISKIQRVNDPGWLISRKLKYFVFELSDGTKIAGLPNCKVLSVSAPFIEDCKVEFENILEVVRLT